MSIRWLTILVLVWGCTGSRAVPEPDAEFGHRYEGVAPDGSHTLTITSAQQAESYRYYPATIDRVFVRPAPFEVGVPSDSQHVEVEVLIKGALPDACMQLHSFQQERAANIVHASLQMRRRQSGVCASARRPYRFYVLLDGSYAVGSYTLLINGESFPFQIRMPSS